MLVHHCSSFLSLSIPTVFRSALRRAIFVQLQRTKFIKYISVFPFYIIPATQSRNLNQSPSDQVSSSPRRSAFSPLDLIRPAIELLTAASGGPGGHFDATLAACMTVSVDLIERVKELGGDNRGLGAQQRSQLRNYWRRLRDVSAQSGYLDGGHQRQTSNILLKSYVQKKTRNYSSNYLYMLIVTFYRSAVFRKRSHLVGNHINLFYNSL